jgi:anti-sigma B factor antagonist
MNYINYGYLLEMIDINIDKVGNVLVVGLAGELDSVSSTDVQDKLMTVIENEERILLDMANVSYMSSAGLRTLLTLYRRIRNQSGRIIITELQDEVRQVMEITGFLDFFEWKKTQTEAMKALA